MSWSSSPDNSPQQWHLFVDHYERLTGLLCVAAHLGCSEEYEREFVQLRAWMLQHYGTVAHRVRPLLDSAFKDQPGDNGSERKMDPFEDLLRPQRLSDLLGADQGDLIPRIAGISECVYTISA